MSSKALKETLSTLAGMCTSSKAVHPLKAFMSISGTEAPCPPALLCQPLPPSFSLVSSLLAGSLSLTLVGSLLATSLYVLFSVIFEYARKKIPLFLQKTEGFVLFQRLFFRIASALAVGGVQAGQYQRHPHKDSQHPQAGCLVAWVKQKFQ